MKIFYNVLFILSCGVLCVLCLKDGDESRPYEFAFTIDGEQHRHEKKDVKGIIQGEFGFITADGIYHVTVYATDENGNFKILSMRNVRISAPLDGSGVPQGQKVAVNSYKSKRPEPQPLSIEEPGPRLIAVMSSTASVNKVVGPFTTQPTIRPACAGCGYVTTSKPVPGRAFGPLPHPSRSEPLNKYFQLGKNKSKFDQEALSAPGEPVQVPHLAPAIERSNAEGILNQFSEQHTLPESQERPELIKQVQNLPDGPVQISRLVPEVDDSFRTNAKPTANPLLLEVSVNPLGIPEINNGLTASVSPLSQVTVDNGIIKVPGNTGILIKDKYPGMTDGLPEGIKEKDITDLLYKFNYTVGFHGHYEKGLKNGAKIGGYFVNGRDGVSRVVTYVADENGFRPKFKFIRLGFDSPDTPKEDTEKMFGLKSFEFIWYPIS